MLLGLLLSGVGQAQDIGRVAEAPEPPDESRRAAYRNGILPLPGALGLTGQGIDILVWEPTSPCSVIRLWSMPTSSSSTTWTARPVPTPRGSSGPWWAEGPCQVHGAAPEATIHMFENEAIEVRMQQWEDQLNAGVGLLSNWSFTAGGDEQHVSIETITHAHRSICSSQARAAQTKTSGAGCRIPTRMHWWWEHRRPRLFFGNSGRGPTQEGRIKPDLVEFGKSLFMPGINPMGNVGVVSFKGHPSRVPSSRVNPL